ncbi:MAG: hypothetical protein R3C49_00565 [Planctomycetaceae bacterium]
MHHAVYEKVKVFEQRCEVVHEKVLVKWETDDNIVCKSVGSGWDVSRAQEFVLPNNAVSPS